MAVCSLLILFSACDTGAMLYTTNELAELYTVNVSSGQLPLGQLESLLPEAALQVELDMDSDAPQPVFAEVRLADASEREIAMLRYARKDALPDGSADITDPQAGSEAQNDSKSISADQLVNTLEGKLPVFSLPGALEDGYYTLTVTLLDKDKKLLTSHTETILVYRFAKPELRISLHPAELEAGQNSLIKAEIDSERGDAGWVRWLVNGSLYREGWVKHRLDRLVWPAPNTQGIHTVQADFYPFEPVAGRNIAPLVSRTIKLPVPASTAASRALLPATYARITMQTEIPEFTTVAAKGLAPKTSMFGKVFAEAGSHGFGHAILENSGLASTTQILPPAGTGFALIVELEPLPSMETYPGNGLIYRIHDSARSELFALGLQEGKLFVRGSKTLTATETFPLQGAAIVLNATPTDDGLLITAFVNEIQQFQGSLSDFRLAKPAENSLAGVDGLAALYRTVAAYDTPVSPFLLGLESQLGKRLLYALDTAYPSHDPDFTLRIVRPDEIDSAQTSGKPASGTERSIQTTTQTPATAQGANGGTAATAPASVATDSAAKGSQTTEQSSTQTERSLGPTTQTPATAQGANGGTAATAPASGSESSPVVESAPPKTDGAQDSQVSSYQGELTLPISSAQLRAGIGLALDAATAPSGMVLHLGDIILDLYKPVPTQNNKDTPPVTWKDGRADFSLKLRGDTLILTDLRTESSFELGTIVLPDEAPVLRLTVEYGKSEDTISLPLLRSWAYSL